MRQSSSRPSIYWPHVDGLRAVAVLAVIVYHCNPGFLPGGYLGVDIFFVISGFVITASLQSRRDVPSLGAYLVSFYDRRIRRILPALLVCVLITALLICLVDPDPFNSLEAGMTALFGFSNFTLLRTSSDYFSRQSDLNVFLHTWSLGVEEQFYFVFPLLVWFSGYGRGVGPGARRLCITLLLAGGASLLAWLVLLSQQRELAFYLMPARFWELAAGSILYLLHRSGRLRAPIQSLPPLLPLSLLLACLLLPVAFELPATLAVVGLSMTLLLHGLEVPRSLLVRMLSHPLMLAIGVLSYSLYLWHWPILVLSRWTIGLSLAMVPLQLALMALAALASYHWLERPLRRRRWAPRPRITLLIALIAAGSATLLLWWLKDSLRHQLYLGRYQAGKRTEQWSNLAVPGTTINPDVCSTKDHDAALFGVAGGFARHAAICSAEPPLAAGQRGIRAPHVYVFGDSHAMAFTPVVAGLLRQGGHGITILSRPGCPAPDTRFGHLDGLCSRVLAASENWILSHGRPGDSVVLVNYLLSHLGDSRLLPDSRDRFRSAQGTPILGGPAKLQAWLDGVARFSARARQRRLQVLVVGATPRNMNYFICRREWYNLQAIRGCQSEVEKQQLAARQLNRQLAAQLPAEVWLFDPLQVLCPMGCSNDRITWLLRDTDHLSLQGARSLAPAFAGVVAPRRPGSLASRLRH